MAATVLSQSKSTLDNLESAFNAILLQTGAVFDDPDYSDSRRFTRTKLRLSRVLPEKLNTFHDALDDLEADLVRARAIMQRDLADARSSRLAAEEQSRVHEVAAASTQLANTSLNTPGAKPEQITSPEAQKVGKTSDPDVVMVEEAMATDKGADAAKSESNGVEGQSSQGVAQGANGSATGEKAEANGSKATTQTDEIASSTEQVAATAVATANTDVQRDDDSDQKQAELKEEPLATIEADDSILLNEFGSVDALMPGMDMGANDFGGFDTPKFGPDMNDTDFLSAANLNDSSMGNLDAGMADMSSFDLDSLLNIDGGDNTGGTDFSKIEFDDAFFNGTS